MNICSFRENHKDFFSKLNNSQPIKGDLINWDDASWDVYGMNNYSSSYSSLCRKNELIKIPGLWDFKSGIAMCNVLNLKS